MRFASSLVICALLAQCFLVVAPARAQEDDEADHAALRKLKAVFEEAASNNDLELLRPHVAETFSAVTFTNREFTDFDAFNERWQKTRDEIVGNGSYKVTLKPVRSEIDGDLAIARGDSDNVLVNSAGKQFHFTSNWTAVCRKVDGEWKIVRAHSSIDPFGNPMLIDGVRTKVIQISGAAVLGGVLLGGIVMYFITRRRGSSPPTP